MLVLTRKRGQSIIIGDQIEIVITAIDGDQIKIGIQAPSTIKVYRKEVIESIRNSNKEAAAVSVSLQQLKDILKSKGPSV